MTQYTLIHSSVAQNEKEPDEKRVRKKNERNMESTELKGSC